MQQQDWHNHDNKFLAMLLAGEPMAPSDAPISNNPDVTLIIAFNAQLDAVNFTFPETQFRWRPVFSTTDSLVDIDEARSARIESRSVHLFELIV